MREVNIQEVGMENFGPYLDPMILQFKNDSMVLITGPNGVGKTMALEAIPYTFYGSTSKGVKGDDVVNNVVGRNCKTWVKFSSNDNQYLVTRYQKYTKLGNTVILTKNKVDIKKGHQEVLPEINKLICSKRAFMNTLMFGQKVKDFFTDLVDSDKKLIFRELLSLEQYQLYYKETDKRLKKVIEVTNKVEKNKDINIGLHEDTVNQIRILQNAERKFDEEKQTAIIGFKNGIETNQRLLNEWKQALLTLEKEDIDTEKTISALSNIELKLNSIQGFLDKQLQSVEQQRKTKLLEIQNKVFETRTEITELSKIEYDRIKDEQTKLKDSLNNITISVQEEKHKIELKSRNIESDIRNWQARANEIEKNVIKAEISECPLCEQEVSEKTIELLTEKVVKYNNDIDHAFKLVSLFQEQINEINANFTKESNTINTQQVTFREEHKQIKQKEKDKLNEIHKRWIVAIEKVDVLAHNELKQIEQKFQQTKNDLNSKKLVLSSKKKDQEHTLKQLDEVKKTIDNINHEIKRKDLQIQDEENEDYDKSQLNSYLKRERELKIKIDECHKEIRSLAKKETMFEFWKTGFSSSGIPSMLIDEAIPFMNEKVSYYLDKFTNGRYIVSFDTLASTKAGEFRDKISVNVVDTHTRANSRIQLSGGQTRIIDIATILTLGDLQKNIQDVSINILLFDEIFDSLDEENIGYVSKVLSNMKFGKSIYLISHRHEDQLEADEVLTLH